MVGHHGEDLGDLLGTGARDSMGAERCILTRLFLWLGWIQKELVVPYRSHMLITSVSLIFSFFFCHARAKGAGSKVPSYHHPINLKHKNGSTPLAIPQPECGTHPNKGSMKVAGDGYTP